MRKKLTKKEREVLLSMPVGEVLSSGLRVGAVMYPNDWPPYTGYATKWNLYKMGLIEAVPYLINFFPMRLTEEGRNVRAKIEMEAAK